MHIAEKRGMHMGEFIRKTSITCMRFLDRKWKLNHALKCPLNAYAILAYFNLKYEMDPCRTNPSFRMRIKR